jgi:hypothetical protein
MCFQPAQRVLAVKPDLSKDYGGSAVSLDGPDQAGRGVYNFAREPGVESGSRSLVYSTHVTYAVYPHHVLW